MSKEINLNAATNLTALIYFPPMVLVFIFNVFTLMLADDGICVYGGKFQELMNGENGKWMCNDIPTFIMMFPAVWFFLGQPVVWAILHKNFAQMPNFDDV